MLEIRPGNLDSPEVIALLDEHLRAMENASPPESRHALDVDGLRKAEITFWTAWDGTDLAGCGALRQIDDKHAEIKSMRTATGHRRKGVASAVLQHLISEARRRGYRRLSLETGSMGYFEPARKLYTRSGFTVSAPFDAYVEDPNSVFMTMDLAP